MFLVQKVHGIDDQRRVGGILAHRVAVLLNRLNGVVEQLLFPRVQRCGGPIAVDALVNQVAQAGSFLKDDAGIFAGDVLGVDQDGDFHFTFHVESVQ